MDLSNCIIYDITTYNNDTKGMKSAFNACSDFPSFFFFIVYEYANYANQQWEKASVSAFI